MDFPYYVIAKWFYNHKKEIFSTGITEEQLNTIIGEDTLEFIEKNKERIERDLDRVNNVTYAFPRYLNIVSFKRLDEIRSAVTRLANLDSILKTAYDIEKESLWYLPSLVNRKDFQERCGEFAVQLSTIGHLNDAYLYITIMAMEMKKNTVSSECLDVFIQTYKNSMAKEDPVVLDNKIKLWVQESPEDLPSD